ERLEAAHGFDDARSPCPASGARRRSPRRPGLSPGPLAHAKPALESPRSNRDKIGAAMTRIVALSLSLVPLAAGPLVAAGAAQERLPDLLPVGRALIMALLAG